MCLLDNSEMNRACYWKEKNASSQLIYLIRNLHEAYTWIWFGGKFKTQNFRNFGSSVCKHEMSSWESESAIELSWLCLTFPFSIFEIWWLTKTPNGWSITLNLGVLWPAKGWVDLLLSWPIIFDHCKECSRKF